MPPVRPRTCYHDPPPPRAPARPASPRNLPKAEALGRRTDVTETQSPRVHRVDCGNRPAL